MKNIELKMKKEIRTILYFAFCILPFAFVISCDKISPPFREEVDIIPTVDLDTICPFSPVAGGAYRKVLAEEFTGHLCGNCPPTSIFLSDTLKPKYDDSLVVITIHAKYFADICPTATACPGTAPP